MEELFLSSFLACDKLNIVDKKQVGLAVTLSEAFNCASLNSFDQLICEIIALYVNDVELVELLSDFGSNGTADQEAE